MTKPNFFSVLLIISAIMFLPVKLSSQVTIGSTATPQEFSILELFSNETMGFRLPQLTSGQRDTLEANLPPLDANGVSTAMGLQIFNTCTRCVDTWNGREWISLCDGNEPPIIINCDGRRMVVPRFAHFNLGGKRFDTAREQMRYAASLEGESGFTCHGSLFGGRFQWGRADWAHAIDTLNNSFTLWTGTAVAANGNAITQADAADVAIAGFNDYGQPLGLAATRFITGTGSWLPTDHSAIDNLWGNGVAIATRTDNIEGLADPGVPGMPGTVGEGQYFQSTSWVIRDNDPCLALGSGWRLPTQEEWELIGNYNCNPANTTGSFPFPASDLSLVPPTPTGGVLSPFTWVRVSCNAGICTPTTTWSSATRNGFVLYRTADLPDGFIREGQNLLAANTPEPFLFLPAAGWRYTSGIVGSVGEGSSYWSSAINLVTSSRTLWFDSSRVYAGSNSNTRADGLSVRCVRD